MREHVHPRPADRLLHGFRGRRRRGPDLRRERTLPRLRLLIRVVGLLVLYAHVPVRQIEGEGRSLARRALDVDLAAEEPRDLPTDREAEPRAAVLAAGGPVRLLERLEDDLLLVVRDADAGVLDVERDHRPGREQRGRLEPAAVLDRLYAYGHGPFLCELEGIREEVLQDLLQPLRIGADVSRH